MASIDKRPNGKWRARWREYPCGPQRTRQFARKIDAQRFLTRIEASQLDGTYRDPAAGRVPLREYGEAWRAAQVHRQSTADRVEVELRLRIYPEFGDRPLASVRPSEVQAWVKGLSTKLAPATVELTARTLASLYRAAIRDRLVVSNPCDGVRLPEKARQRVDPPSVEVVRALDAVVPARFRAAVTLGAGAGLRQGEAFGLTVDRVDFLRRSVRVDRQLVTPKSGAPSLGPPKRPASVRTIPVGRVVTDVLAAHLARFDPGPDGLIFTGENGRAVTRNRAADVVRAAATKAGAPEVRFHDLRHFYASALIRKGLSVKVVQARLGHASAVETLDVYGHLWPDDEDRTRQAVDELLGGELAEDWLRTEAGE
jgi:integrase